MGPGSVLLISSILLLTACRSEESGSVAASARQPGSQAEAPSADPDPPTETPPPPPPAPAPGPLDFRRVRIDPDRFVGSRQLCDVRFAEGPLRVPSGLLADHPAVSTASARMNVECASTEGTGTWVDLFLPPDSDPTEVAPGSRIEVDIISAYDGTAGHSAVTFVSRTGPGYAPERRTERPPDDGFDFTQARRRPNLIGTRQRCRVDFASQLSIVDQRDRYRHGYPADASLRMDLRCVHENGDSWLDVVLTPDDAETSLEVRRGANAAVTIVKAQGGFADYPVVRLAPE